MPRSIAFAFLFLLSEAAFAGRVWLSNLDADYHASFDPCPGCLNPAGAQELLRTAIGWARNGDTRPFLWVESDIIPPYAALDSGGFIDGSKAFHARGEVGLQKAGFAAGVDYEKRTGATLAAALANLSSYSAIVVASDFGGILTAAELSVLNAHRAEIAAFLDNGGGIFAMAQTNDGIGRFDPKTGLADETAFTDSTRSMLKCCQGLLGTERLYGFLPFSVQTVSSFGVLDTPGVISADGRRKGVTDAMLTGNVSHLYFAQRPGFTPLSVSADGQWTNMIWTPEPSTFVLAVAAGAGLLLSRRR